LFINLTPFIPFRVNPSPSKERGKNFSKRGGVPLKHPRKVRVEERRSLSCINKFPFPFLRGRGKRG